MHRSIISLSGLSLSAAACVSASLLLPSMPEFRVLAGAVGGLSGCLAIMGSKQIHERRGISFQQLADQFILASNTQSAAIAVCIFSASVIPNSSTYPYRQLDFWFKSSAFVLALTNAQSFKGFLQSDPLGKDEFDFGIQQSVASVWHEQQQPQLMQAQSEALTVPVKEEKVEKQQASPVQETSINIPTQGVPQAWTPDVEDNQYTWVEDLLEYPSILVWGPQGSGKSTFVEWLIYERIKRGHTVKILDPHREAGQWEGLEVVGDGMDYEAIDTELSAFDSQVKSRYGQRAKIKGYNPKPITLLCEEFTQWSKKCDHSAEFFETSLTDIRKVNMNAVYVAHNRTLTALGGTKGLAATRDAGLLEIELEAIVDPTTKKAHPAFKGKLKYPNQDLKEAQTVAIAKWMRVDKTSSPTSVIQQETSVHQHFNPESKVAFEDRRLLPTHSGIYCVVDSKDTPLYVGEAGDIRLRWNPAKPQYLHHWLPAIDKLIAQGEQIFIYSKVCSNREELEAIVEAQLKPRWNGRSVQEVVQELSERSNVQEAERLNPLMNAAERLNVQLLFDAFSPISPELRDRVQTFKRMGVSIQETIESTFTCDGKPVTKGGSKGYQKAREVYEQIIQEAEL